MVYGTTAPTTPEGERAYAASLTKWNAERGDRVKQAVAEGKPLGEILMIAEVGMGYGMESFPQLVGVNTWEDLMGTFNLQGYMDDPAALKWAKGEIQKYKDLLTSFGVSPEQVGGGGTYTPLGAGATYPSPAGEAPPTEGEYRTFGNLLYQFVNGEWVAAEYNYPASPTGYQSTEEGMNMPTEYTPTPYGGMGSTPDWGQTNYPVGSPEWWELVGGAKPGYMGALGLLGKEYQKPFEQYQAGMFDPLHTMWQNMAPMAMMGYPSMDPGTGMFSQWAPQYAQNPFAMYGMARGMLGNVMGMSPEQRGTLGMGGGAGSFANLLQMGLRERLGPGASWLAGRVPKLQEQWMAQDPLSGGGSFIDYIRNKYNLGQYF